MKYIILLLIVITIILAKPWEISFAGGFDTRNTRDTTLFRQAEQKPASLLPINQVITNKESELPETQQFDRRIERFIQKWQIKGASFSLMKDGKLLYSKGYGYADKEAGVKTDVQHIFRIASVSKLITATGIMKLVEENKLSLNAEVFGLNGILNDSIYLDIKDSRSCRITVEELLRHQGGYSTAYGDPMFCPSDIAEKLHTSLPINLDQMIQFVLSRRLRFEPGTATQYSNIGYGILSKVIEKVSGESYESYIQNHILKPASCSDMHLGHNFYDKKYPNEVRYYELPPIELYPACDGSNQKVPKCYGGNNIEELYGAGGWVASSSELLRFLTAIDGKPDKPDILKPESIALMTAYHLDAMPIGWMHITENGDWTRTGTLSGTSALMKQQTDGYAWVLITNTSNWQGSKFTQSINRMITDAMATVKSWPDRDLFDCQRFDHTQLLVKQ